jgi:hypothetical protein
MLGRHPELRRVGIAEAFHYAAAHRDRYADYFDDQGQLAGPGFETEQAAGFPEHLRASSVVSRSVAEM